MSTLWNKLFPQEPTLQDLDQIFGVSHGSSTVDPNQLAGMGQQITTGGLQLPAVQTVHVSPNHLGGNGLTTQQIQSILQTLSTLTPEERAELEQLKKEHEQAIKVAKLTEFKKLPSELRQFVVNVISWQEAKVAIETANADKSERQKELEQKENNSNLFSHGSTLGGISQWVGAHTHAAWNPPNIDLFSILPIPSGLTAEELKEAHMEATLEEEMLEKDEANT